MGLRTGDLGDRDVNVSFGSRDLLGARPSLDTDLDSMFGYRHTDHLAELTATALGSPDFVRSSAPGAPDLDDLDLP